MTESGSVDETAGRERQGGRIAGHRHDIPELRRPLHRRRRLRLQRGSKALLESLEFTQEGRQRKVAFHDGEYHDDLEYGMLREAWTEQR